MEIMERRCRHCKIIYKPEKFSSYILFCSRCKREVFFNSNFDGETPCIIYLGEEAIGEIRHISDDNYKISSDRFGIDEVINNSKRPFIEIENYLNQAIGFLHGSMDVHEGVLLLHNEKLQKFYSFKEFKNTDMFLGQNGEMPFTLKDIHNIDNHNYYVSLLFKQGFLYEISLVCNDIEKDSYSMEKEKALHDSILKEYGLRNDEDLE